MSNDVNKTELKQLRNEVQRLRDELAIMKRKYEDIIYNLDDDNFSSRFVKEKGDMKTAIEITAEGIKTKVSKAELDKSLESTITQTAGMIQSEVKALYDNDDMLYTEISQTADSIKSVVSKNISVKFQKEDKPTDSNTTDAQKGMLCEYGENLYYFNDITNTWKKYPHADGVKSQFLQTESGFELMGDVSVRGKLISEGETSGYSQMDAYGFSVYDAADNHKVCIGYKPVNKVNYPYMELGVGAGNDYNDSGIILKLGCGVWIGDSSVLKECGDYPGGYSILYNISAEYSNATGLFIDFYEDKIYKYIKGVPTEISTSSGGSGTAIAVFG